MPKSVKLILPLLILLTLQIIFTIQISIKYKNIKVLINEQFYQFQKKQDFLEFNLSLAHKYSCVKINPNISLKNRKNHKFLFSNILRDSISYFLYVPPSFCSSCNEEALKMLPNMLEIFGTELKLLCSPTDVNSVKVYSDNKIIDENLLISDDPILLLPDLSKLYLLVITNSRQIKTLFMIDNDNVKLTVEYLKLNYSGS